jgi:hypothetical protein
MPRTLEKRVADLEKQIEQLRRQQNGPSDPRAWVDDLYGKFAGDPIFEQAMKLGRDYRISLRPRAGKRKSRR